MDVFRYVLRWSEDFFLSVHFVDALSGQTSVVIFFFFKQSAMHSN